jgi:hypothetical protein
MPSNLTLSAYRRPVRGPLHLLSRSENGLTFAFGYALARVPKLIDLFLADLGIRRSPGCQLSITLQEPDEDGITDIELWLPQSRLLAIVEAKKNGWPGPEQLSRYARRLQRNGSGLRALVPLGVAPQASPMSGVRGLRGVHLVPRRWADVLRLVSDALVGRNTEHADILRELKELIQEVIKMRSYDREVLIRDVRTEHASAWLFLDLNIYACQVRERSEPLFFAPCVTGAKNSRANGIHYVSRVYCRSLIDLRRAETLKAALGEAKEAVSRISRPLRTRKTARDQYEYLDSLPRKWLRGVAALRDEGWRGPTAVYFLGDPMRLPVPLAKKGSMVPIGFSMTLEQLMSARPGTFSC